MYEIAIFRKTDFYDDYRYEHDDDYRDGVDDAIDEMGDDW